MKKIPTLFVRDFSTKPPTLTSEVTPGCEWVLEGKGTPTRKWDGTCMMFDGQLWWARREVKEFHCEPAGFQFVEQDLTTRSLFGWEPAGDSPFEKYYQEALENNRSGVFKVDFQPGTYELVGPKINGNHDTFKEHRLCPHGKTEILIPGGFPNTFEGIRGLFTSSIFAHMEGVVWWHKTDPEKKAKLKRRDFR